MGSKSAEQLAILFSPGKWLLIDVCVLSFGCIEWFAVHCVEDEAARKDSRYHLKSVNAETRGILDELDRTYSAPVCAFVVENC